MPKVKVFSRLNLTHTTLSKRKLAWFIDTGRTSGWDDPRMPTVQGVIRRGLTVDALKDYILELGFSVKENLCAWDKIWSINKKKLDPIAPRQTAVATENCFTMVIEGAPEIPRGVTAAVHPKKPEMGKKVIRVSNRVFVEGVDVECFDEGKEVTLIEWGNVLINEINFEKKEVKAKLNLKGDYKKTMKVSWLADAKSDLVCCRIVTLNEILTVPKLEDGVSIEDIANDNTWIEEMAYGDPNLRLLKKGAIIQLQRKGFAIVEEPLSESNGIMVLIMIPDSRKIVKKRLPLSKK